MSKKKKASPKILFRPVLGCCSQPKAFTSLAAAQKVVLEAEHLWLGAFDESTIKGGDSITLNSDDNWIEVIEVVDAEA